MQSVRRLFHAVVVLGAALSACRGETRREPASGGGEGGTGGGVGGGGAGGQPAGGSTCVGSAEAPADCLDWADFFCDPCDDDLSKQVCRCDAAAPDDPSDCDKTQDYHCQSYSPMTGCSCLPGSPASDADCPGGEMFCMIEDPPIGCDCITTITK